jgi:hypothetical protein
MLLVVLDEPGLIHGFAIYAKSPLTVPRHKRVGIRQNIVWFGLRPTITPFVTVNKRPSKDDSDRIPTQNCPRQGLLYQFSIGITYIL